VSGKHTIDFNLKDKGLPIYNISEALKLGRFKDVRRKEKNILQKWMIYLSSHPQTLLM
jgi:hypothetical protein